MLVGKKVGSLRLCVDHRKLNSATVSDAYPLPRVDDTLDFFWIDVSCFPLRILPQAAGRSP